jgi:TolB-like protein
MAAYSIATMTIATVILVTALVAAPKPPTVAVSYFDNNTGQAELAPLAKGLADMLITDLAAVPGIQIVEREKLNEALAELKLSSGRFIDPATAQKLGRGLAARYLLTGGYTMAGPTLRIDARVFNVETAAVLASERVEGKRDEFFELEARLVTFLATALQVKLGPAGTAPSKAAGTRSFVAWSQYSAGLDAQDQGDQARARALFEQALRTDPAYRAARTAQERLEAIFARRTRETIAAADRTFEGLDPAARDFAPRVDALLAGLDNTRGDQLSRKVKVLTWLGERGLLACAQRAAPATGNSTVMMGGAPMGGGVAGCRQATEVLLLAYRQTEDPSQWEVIPKICESFIRQLPADPSIFQYCESPIMKKIAMGQERGAKQVLKDLKDERKFNAKLKPDDWRRALLDNDAAIKAMLSVYARGAEPAVTR